MTITRRQIVASLGLEAVDFQYNKVFFQELVLAVAKLRALPRRTKEAVVGINLGGIIEHHTGIKATCDVDSASYANAWVFPPMLDVNHTLLNDFWRFNGANKDSLDAIRRSGGAIKGTVNRTTGRVTGVFTQFTPAISVTQGCFRVMSNEEIAAIILHEVGHCMSFFELLGQQMTTNMALKAASDAFLGNTSGEQRYKILTALEENLHIKFEDKDKLKDARPEVLTTVVLKRVVEASRSEGGTPLYDYSGWEYMSDQYATRCGAGRYLVTALDKMQKDAGSYHIEALRSPIGHLFLEAVSLVKVVIFGVSVAVLGSLGLVGGIVVTGLVLAFNIWGGGLMSGQRTYDTPEARLKRMRNELVEGLKVQSISSEQRQALLEDLAVVDTVVKDYTDRKDIFEYLYTLLSPNRRQQEREMVIQQELEKLVSNDLYIRAAKFKNLSAS